MKTMRIGFMVFLTAVAMVSMAGMMSPAQAQSYQQYSYMNQNRVNFWESSSQSGGGMVHPMTFQFLPVESGALRSRIGFGMQFSMYPDYSSSGGGDIAALVFSLEAQAALMDVIELGVNVPFAERGYFSGIPLPVRDFHFGNVQANVKAKVYGQSRGPLAVSLYANTTLPTTSLDIGSREYVILQPGLAVSGVLAGIATLGLSTGTWMAFISGGKSIFYNIDLFTAVRLGQMFALQVAWQMGIPIHPSGSEFAFVISPAVQMFLAKNFHIDVGGRIAVTDGSRAFTGGRAALVAGMGIDFD